MPTLTREELQAMSTQEVIRALDEAEMWVVERPPRRARLPTTDSMRAMPSPWPEEDDLTWPCAECPHAASGD